MANHSSAAAAQHAQQLEQAVTNHSSAATAKQEQKLEQNSSEQQRPLTSPNSSKGTMRSATRLALNSTGNQ